MVHGYVGRLCEGLKTNYFRFSLKWHTHLTNSLLVVWDVNWADIPRGTCTWSATFKSSFKSLSFHNYFMK